MDYSKFRRSSNIDPQGPDQLTADVHAWRTAGMPITDEYVPNYPLQATPQQLANPLANELGLRALIEALLQHTNEAGVGDLSARPPMPLRDPRK